MIKPLITIIIFFSFSNSFSQWTRVSQLPSSDIASLYHKDDILYAGGKNIIYISQNNGLTWDSTSTIPNIFLVTSIIVYKNELYAAAPHKGVFKSPDGGRTWQVTTWQNFNNRNFPDVSDFCEFRGGLYASTLGNSVYNLNPATRNTWLFFSNGLSNLGVNLPSIASNSNAIIAGTLANGIYGHLPANSTTWEERLLAGELDPNEGAYDIVTAHDTIFYSGRTGKFYMSTDNGLSWNFIGNRLASAATTLVNAKQAVLSSRHIFEGGSFKVLFYYIKKDALQNPFVNFSVVSDNHFTYKIDILGDKLWDASNKGLFFMPLSDLPGISAADDSVAAIIWPVRFISFYANCEGNKILLAWKTAQEQSSSHFNIERSSDGISWTVIGSLPADRNSEIAKEYFFSYNTFIQNGLYRIAEYDFNGRVQYSSIVHSSCNTIDVFRSWPSPAHDILYVNIITGNQSQAIIKLFDNKGALVTAKKITVLKGSNQISMDISSLSSEVYSLSVSWNNGQMNKAVQVLKK
jgi:hypothetical protein